MNKMSDFEFSSRDVHQTSALPTEQQGINLLQNAALPADAGSPFTETIHEPFQDFRFFDRDLSWLFFNERVLLEAENEEVPLLERLRFLSIYSSNLDEFYRVRIPALTALHKLYQKNKVTKREAKKHADVLSMANELIMAQQDRFGETLEKLLPELENNGIVLHYGKMLPPFLLPQLTHYFFTEVLSFLKPHFFSDSATSFFPENNQLYLAVTGTGEDGREEVVVVNIPTQDLPRFYRVVAEGRQHVVFLDDIIRAHLAILPGIWVTGCHSFKITRDAELDLKDEYAADMAQKIEQQIAKRDYGMATRFLYDPRLPAWALQRLQQQPDLAEAMLVAGGRYHNLKDLHSLPVDQPALQYAPWPPLRYPVLGITPLLEVLEHQDLLIHPPFHGYDTVLRFFNEAAMHPEVKQIYLTLYRVAQDSRIVNALLSAAHNGKQVTVLIELKARFDEANNLKWAKKLKKAGVQVLYTPASLKVHAKTALLVSGEPGAKRFTGLLATGNLNESTARFYTDHILLTSHTELLQEVEMLFHSFLSIDKEPEPIRFAHLLVARQNLPQRFLELIDREIYNTRSGAPGRIILKLNNLEERVLIKRLYAASCAGVQIDLIVRGICCLVPGVTGMSENIRVRRIVDRYLEHGRIYIFANNGNTEVYLGSADWMNRNIYRRIEVCFPLYDEALKNEMQEMIALQLQDNTQAVAISPERQNNPVPSGGERVRSQERIYQLLAAKQRELCIH